MLCRKNTQIRIRSSEVWITVFLRSSPPMAARQSTFRVKLPGTDKDKSSAEQIWLHRLGKPCGMFRPLLKLLVARWQTSLRCASTKLITDQSKPMQLEARFE